MVNDKDRYDPNGYYKYWIHQASGIFMCDAMTKERAEAYIKQCEGSIHGPYCLGEVNELFIHMKEKLMHEGYYSVIHICNSGPLPKPRD